jgi:hypothetical protein
MSLNWSRTLKIFAATTTVFAAAEAAASRARCNDRQSACYVRNKSLAIGDTVGVFTKDNELVAVGKVENINGAERKVEFNKRFGVIRQTHRFALLDTDSMESITKSYSIYKQPARITAGGGMGLAKIGIGDGASGMLIDGYGSYGWKKNFELVGRASFLNISGQANGDFGAPFSNGEFTMTGFGVTPAIAYHHNKHRTWSARAEVGVGFMYGVAEVENDPKLLKYYVTSVESGFGMLARADANVLYRVGDWQPGAGFSYLRIQDAQGFNLGILLSRDIQ